MPDRFTDVEARLSKLETRVTAEVEDVQEHFAEQQKFITHSLGELRRELQEFVTDRLAEQTRQLEQRLDGVETRLDGVETRLDRVEARLDQMGGQLEEILRRLPEPPAQFH